jgi:rhodanese-related sulfurtransferase/DNA-binding transcriptional ArsR family regulator
VGNRVFKNALYGQVARVGKALASPQRIEMLELLSQSPRTVMSLAEEMSLSMGSASAHLQVLREARLVDARKDGLNVHYSLAEEAVADLLLGLRGVAERRLAEIDRLVATYLGDRDTLEAVGFEELAGRVRAGTVVVLDVRPRGEYESGHIAGAISIPHDELERRLRELPRGKDVVAYCRGPYCVFADEAVKTLRSHSRKALRLDGGYPEWRAAGRAVEHGPPR